MRHVLLLILTLAIGSGAAFADEGEDDKKKSRAERVAEQNKRKEEAKRKAKEKRKEQAEQRRQKAEERFKKQDSRTRWAVALKLRSKKHVEEIASELQKLSSIDEATLDKEKSSVDLVLASSARITLNDLSKALRKVRAELDERQLTLPKHFVVALKGDLDGTRFQREKGRKRGWRYTNGQKLLTALKEVDGVRSVSYPNARSIKIGCDRNIKFSRVKTLVLDHGSKGKGSAYIADVKIEGAKQVAKKPDPAPKKRKADKGKDDDGEVLK